jgi:hypothetical protein
MRPVSQIILTFKTRDCSMKFFLSKKIMLVSTLLITAAVIIVFLLPKSKIDFNTQVKPIFNKKCIACHGGVKQKSGFSLLFREEALGKTESGKPAIVPGNPGESELIRRITTKDTDERMPYKHEALSSAEIEILRQWIKEGATWGLHWAYAPVKEQELPDYSDNGSGMI